VIAVRFERVTWELARPLVTAREVIRAREALRVWLEGPGEAAVGDAAPLPWFGTESLDEAEGAAGLVTTALVDEVLAAASAADAPLAFPGLARLDATPTLRAAVATAVAGLLARRRNASLAALFAERPAGRVGVNAILGATSPDAAAAEAQEAWSRGARVLKLKVGAARLDDDLARVRAVRAAAPLARLRLDANGAWDVAASVRSLDALAESSIELCEQPVRADDLDGLLEVASRSRCPIAADEALLTRAGRERLVFPGSPLSALVLKPSALGGPDEAVALARRARGAGMNVIVTTLIDGPVMRAMAAEVAAAADPEATSAHGLDTQALFRDRSAAPDPYEPVAGVIDRRIDAPQPAR
jgi:o-succinylbenzoate synthase